MPPDSLVDEALSQSHLDASGRGGVRQVRKEDSRNDVWIIELEGDQAPLALKVQAEDASVPTVVFEGRTLRQLQGHPGVPTLCNVGVVGAQARPFILTELLPGRRLQQALPVSKPEVEQCLVELSAWLHRFSRIQLARPTLHFLGEQFSGPWSPWYAPGSAPPVVEQASSVNAGHDKNRLGLVHGSFDPGNILLDQAHQRLVFGVIDFEATRLGSPLIDIAGLALHFLLADRPDLATSWLATAATEWGWPGLTEAVIPYLEDHNERRKDAASTGSVDFVSKACLRACGGLL